MSPEQVRGKPADARSDIFSFGAILYEMLSGKRAFHGDSAADTMSAILKEDPPDLSVTNQSVPPGLERIVRHCLEKNPEQRFHSAHDVAFALEALSNVSATGRAMTSATAGLCAHRRLPPLAPARCRGLHRLHRPLCRLQDRTAQQVTAAAPRPRPRTTPPSPSPSSPSARSRSSTPVSLPTARRSSTARRPPGPRPRSSRCAPNIPAPRRQAVPGWPSSPSPRRESSPS